jgi:hypothetical protein
MMRPARHMALSPGTRIGPYEITALVGAGGITDADLADIYAFVQSRPEPAKDIPLLKP